MVRLEEAKELKIPLSVIYFNSCMVRLEENWRKATSLVVVLFQFLYGTIGRKSFATHLYDVGKFQFLYGTIGRRLLFFPRQQRT